MQSPVWIIGRGRAWWREPQVPTDAFGNAVAVCVERNRRRAARTVEVETARLSARYEPAITVGVDVQCPRLTLGRPDDKHVLRTIAVKVADIIVRRDPDGFANIKVSVPEVSPPRDCVVASIGAWRGRERARCFVRVEEHIVQAPVAIQVEQRAVHGTGLVRELRVVDLQHLEPRAGGRLRIRYEDVAGTPRIRVAGTLCIQVVPAVFVEVERSEIPAPQQVLLVIAVAGVVGHDRLERRGEEAPRVVHRTERGA